MSDYPARPQTPQAMLHRLPDKPDISSESTRPSKFIILIMASTAVAGKVQIAKSVSSALSCPLFQGDSLHESSAKAAMVGAATESGANEGRYQRMWLSKMTRTGLLFPEESRAANAGFSGFGGTSSNSTSRRGSTSSVASMSSDAVGSVSSVASSFGGFDAPPTAYVNKPVLELSGDQELRKANPALMVLTHPELEKWHRESVRNVVGEYGIGIIFVPLYKYGNEDEGGDDLPVLKPLDPRTMTSFSQMGSFGTPRKVALTLEEEIVLRVNVNEKIEDLIEDVIEGVRDIMAR